jgi:hypothetical protein
VHVEEEHYARATKDFINYFSTIKGTLSILRFGNMSANGLSDLDFLVVFDPDYHHKFGTVYGLQPFSSTTRYILFHPQLSAPLQVAKKVHRVFPVRSMETVWGKGIIFETFDKDTQRKVYLNHLLDMMILAFPREYLKLIVTRELRLRYAISQLNLFQYFASLLKLVLEVSESNWQTLADDIACYRANFFQTPTQTNIELIKSLLCRAFEFTYEMVFALNQMVAPACFSISDKVRRYQYHSPGLDTIFYDLIDSEEGIRRSMKAWEERREIAVFLPRTWAGLLFFYASRKGPVSNHIRNYLKPSHATEFWVDVNIFSEKIELLNNHVEFLNAKNIPGVLFPCFGYQADCGYGFWEKQYLRLKMLCWR